MLGGGHRERNPPLNLSKRTRHSRVPGSTLHSRCVAGCHEHDRPNNTSHTRVAKRPDEKRTKIHDSLPHGARSSLVRLVARASGRRPNARQPPYSWRRAPFRPGLACIKITAVLPPVDRWFSLWTCGLRADVLQQTIGEHVRVFPDARRCTARLTQIDVKVSVINPAPRRKAHIRSGCPLVSSFTFIARRALAGARCRFSFAKAIA